MLGDNSPGESKLEERVCGLEVCRGNEKNKQV